MKCLCGCGAETKGQWAQGHHKRPVATVIGAVEVNSFMPELKIIADDTAARMPPPHPAPFDHRLFRLAVEPPGTLVSDPWREIPCSECKDPCFTRERKAEYGNTICEECLWRLSEDLGQGQTKQARIMSRTPHNPFE